jgi:hypothetical protein
MHRSLQAPAILAISALLAAMAALPAMAAKAAKIDLNTPEGANAAARRTQCSDKDGEATTYWFHGEGLASAIASCSTSKA